MGRTQPAPSTTLPIAVIGTIALSLTAGTTAASAAQTPSDRSPLRAVPHPAASAAAVAVSDAAAAQTAAARKVPASHTVVRGDTVSAIAAKHGLRTADVLAWNGLGWKSIIRPGDVIALSADGASAGSSSKTTQNSKTTQSDRADATPTTRAASQHTVKKGDTLWAIARSEGVSLAALLRANGLTSGSIIYPGQKIVVPGAASTSSTPATKEPARTTSSASPEKPAPASAPEATAPNVKLDAEQIAGAKTIIAVGRELGVPDRGIAIALATAMVESWIRNLDYGTYDSLGLFQQRPSMGWGSADQVRDPRRAAAAFYGGPNDPNGSLTRGLLDIAGWQDMGFGAAAQAVQRSAYPSRYGAWEAQAYQWLADHG